jgi:hypothetical protein
MASHAPKVAGSEPGMRSRQINGPKGGRSSRMTSTLVIFTLEPLDSDEKDMKKIYSKYYTK